MVSKVVYMSSNILQLTVGSLAKTSLSGVRRGYMPRDLSQGENKNYAQKVKVVILSENSCHFVNFSDFNNSSFFLSLR